MVACMVQAFLHPSQASNAAATGAKAAPSMFSHLPAASSGSLYGRVSPLWRGVGMLSAMQSNSSFTNTDLVYQRHGHHENNVVSSASYGTPLQAADVNLKCLF